MAVEPRVRRVVAASIGRDADSLKPATALGLDPLALLDVARALEDAFGVTLPEADLDRVRTCRDFASLVARRVASRSAGEPPATGPVWVRVIPADPGRPLLERLVELSPYMVETIVEDARVPGRYRRLEVILGPGQSERVAAQVEAVFAPARAAGLVVEIHREGKPRAARQEPAAGVESVLQLLADLALRVGRLLYELQQERGLACVRVASERRPLGAELAAQQITTDRALADLAGFVTSGRSRIPEPVHATIVTSLATLAQLPDIRRAASTLEAAMQGYGRIDRQLVAVGAAIAATMPDAEYGRMAKSYLALLEARESAALEGLRRREPAAADPVGWLRTMSGKLERLREVEESQLAALSRRAAARAGRG
jgi:acyl carrier protein